MAAIGVFDMTKVMSVRNNISGPIVKPTKRTAFASVRYNTSDSVAADFMPTQRAALASARTKTYGPIVAKEKRTAHVTVCNNTSYPLVGVSVVHKYSNVYKNQHQWGVIHPSETPSDYMEVEYNTGFLTTGLDWWLVSWFSTDMRTLYYSDPTNFRGLLDTMESYAPDAIAAAAGAVVGLSSSLTGPGAVGAAMAAAVAAKATTSALFNDESTAGFKEHLLRDEDANAVTVIVINPDLTITFNSPSGVSNTVSSSKPAPGQ